MAFAGGPGLGFPCSLPSHGSAHLPKNEGLPVGNESATATHSFTRAHSLRKHFPGSGVLWGGVHFLPVQVVSNFRQTTGTVGVMNPISSMRSGGLEFYKPFLSTSRRCLRPGEEEDRIRP